MPWQLFFRHKLAQVQIHNRWLSQPTTMEEDSMQLEGKRLMQLAMNDGLLISLLAIAALVTGLSYDNVLLIGLGFGGILVGSFRAVFCLSRHQTKAANEA